MSKTSLINNLNSLQQQAVESKAGVAAVQAGPGTGKTLTLTAKLLSLLKQGKAANEITALTFTNKAAQEMRERAAGYLSSADKNQLPFIGTFHGLAVRLLDIDLENLISEFHQRQLLAAIIKQQQLPLKVKAAQLVISNCKNQAVDPDNLPAHLKKLVKTYNHSLAKLDKLDYDDLLLNLLQRSQFENNLINGSLLIDEFQDLNKLQHQLLLEWQPGLKQLFVIGDQYQSIYGFRGADASGFDWLKQHFPDSEFITLKKNYRNPQQIIDTAHCLFPDSTKLRSAVDYQIGRAHV